MRRLLCLAALGVWPILAQQSNTAILERAKRLELPGKYEAPPGERARHEAAGYARVMCNAVFLTGLDPAFAAENVGYFVAPYESRARLGKPAVDRAARTVTVGGVTAKDIGSQGCAVLPIHFKPVTVRKRVEGTKTLPMGDTAKFQAAVDAAFDDPKGMTAAFVVLHKGRIVGERYAPGISATTPLESWSMGKSVSATLLGILMREGVYKLDQPAPIPEWQKPGDPRAKIRIEDLLHMSSGLRCRAPNDPDFDPNGPYPDHLYLYTTPGNAFEYAATRPQQWPPNTVGRYRNTDPVLVNYLVRLGVEKRKEEYLSFPQRALFDKLGIGSMVLETDSHGNFLAQGYDLAAARDWAKLGLLYAQDGVWNGERILPEGFVKFARTLAPAWKADGRPIYGGFFWLNGDRRFAALPEDAYSMMGAGGQFVTIVPSYDLVVVRLGFYKGATEGERSLNRAFAALMKAVQ